jgi:hypothetical protein
MTKRDFLAIAIRIIGLTFFVRVIIGLPQILGMLSSPFQGRGMNTIWSDVVAISLMSTVSVILMGCANGIARSLMAEDSKLDWPEWLCDKAVLFDFGARIYGVVLLARSIPLLIAAIVEKMQAGDVNIQLTRSADQSILASAITFVFGVCLVVGIGRIAGWLRNITGQGKKMLEGPNA